MIVKHGLLGLAFVGSLAVLAGPVVAGSGWLLLAPPELPRLGDGDTMFAVNAPLDRWKQVQAFDTAKECERGKDEEWSHALKEVETLLPYPPIPKTEAPPQSQTVPKIEGEPKAGYRKGFEEMIQEVIEEGKRQEAMMTEEQKQKRELAWEEWRRERDKIEVAREPKQHAINERYRPWKCVPADAVYRAPK